jgi:hypothetical protein
MSRYDLGHMSNIKKGGIHREDGGKSFHFDALSDSRANATAM